MWHKPVLCRAVMLLHFLLCLSFFPHFWRQGLRMLRLALNFLCSSQSLPPSAMIMEVYHHPSLIYHLLFFGNTRVIFWGFNISWDRISASSGWPQTLYFRVTDLELWSSCFCLPVAGISGYLIPRLSISLMLARTRSWRQMHFFLYLNSYCSK